MPTPPGSDIEFLVWRHPRPLGAAGRCIGHTDLRVDPRRTHRLASRIAATTRHDRLAREIWTSPLARCADVGRELARRHRFVHHIDARLAELDFGRWDGMPWNTISPNEVACWEADFAHFAPGGGEALMSLARRVRDFVHERAADNDAATVLVVGHAGWINAARLTPAELPRPGRWPAAIAYEASIRLRFPRGSTAP